MIYATSGLESLGIVLGLVAIFGVIVIAVILVKKYGKHFKSDEKPKSEKEIADEEVKRMVVDPEDENAVAMDEASKELAETSKKDPNQPDEEEAVADEVNRATRPVENEEAAKAMARYAAEHPEEADAVSSKEDKAEEKKDEPVSK
jgi:FtsZ-interacting cell division protein ZipA